MALNGYIELSRMNLHDPLQLAKYIEKESKIVSTIEDQIRFTRDYQNMGVKAPGLAKSYRVHRSGKDRDIHEKCPSGVRF